MEDDFERSARDTVITEVLLIACHESAHVRMLKVLFCISSDDFNYMGFMGLHKAVLGIVPVDIGAGLQRMDLDLRQQVQPAWRLGILSVGLVCCQPAQFVPFYGCLSR